MNLTWIDLHRPTLHEPYMDLHTCRPTLHEPYMCMNPYIGLPCMNPYMDLHMYIGLPCMTPYMDLHWPTLHEHLHGLT